NAQTGEVTVNENIDFGAQSSYSFSILANDGVQLSFQSVTLDVVDQDLEAPVIISLDSATINENSGADQVIYTAISQDESVVSYSLVAGHDADLSIDSVTGEVSLSSDPDHEVKTEYSFIVAVEDAEGNSVQQSVTVSVVDLDDANPTITSGITATAIDENSGSGQVIYTVTADDSTDISDGVTFSLSEDSDEALIINASSGQVSLIDDPDHEVKTEYSFTVIATDVAGNESAGQSMTLAINNLDDTLPTITSDGTVTAIDENSGAGQVIYTATAEDVGDGTDGLVSFSLAAGSDDGLSVDAVTGEVSITADPNYESKDQYSFTVVATDTAGNQDEQALSLNINNLDELAPVFNSLVNASVLESAPSGSLVYRTLVDDSADTSAGVTFSLTGDSDSALSINDQTGEVTLNEALDFIEQSSYSFTVVATDAAGNQSQLPVTLSVIDQDLEPPEFTSATTGSIDENSGDSQVIYTALTNDESIVSYSLTEDSDANLTINASTGEVTLSANPNYEEVTEYNFTVMAIDTMGNESLPHSVVIDVNNLDDTPATITSGDIVNAIDENSGAGQVIYTATADDSADVSGGITFALTDGSDDALSIDESTGEVTLSVNPNFEDQGQYSFAVIVTDTAGNISAEKSLVLDINNLDDTAPIVTSASSATDLIEDTGENQVIYTATADDSADISGGVTFSLETDDAALTINEVTGEVRLSDNPSYMVKASYGFTVTATDAAGNLSTSQAVTLAILEAAPPIPVISLDSDTGSFTDDSISQTGLVNVSDLKQGATWEYSLDDGESWTDGVGTSFTIDSDGVYPVKVRQTNASETFTTSMENALQIQVDNAVPQVQSITADADDNKVIITYDELLSDATPLVDDYEVTRNGEELVVDSVVINGSTIELAVANLESGSLQVKYTPSASPNLITDLAGNELIDGFSQIIVSDGYIRGAVVYEDVNNDGIAQDTEIIDGVTSDEFGQIILGAQYADSQIIVKGGVNMDSGASNELELTAPAGYAVINPLTTLVQEIVSNSSGDEELTGVALEAAVAAAEQDVSTKLGIELNEGEDLSTYDPLSDQSINNQRVVAQIATVLAVASAEDQTVADDSSDAEATALANLAEIVTNSEGQLEIDAQIVEDILSDGEDGSLVSNLTALTNAVAEMKEAETLEEVVEAQALVIDNVRPNTPLTELSAVSNLGMSNSDALTSDDSPLIRFTFDTQKNDGSAVVEGDTLEIFNTGITVAEMVLSDSDIKNGYVEYQLSNLSEGNFLVSASITDRASNMSYVSNLRFEVDTSALSFVEKQTELVSENAGESQVIYRAEVAENDFWKFELSNNSDANVSINADTGVVTVDHNPDYEIQSSYSFTVLATDRAGNISSQSVVGDIVNMDEIAPEINSGDAADAIDENGLSQVIYTATADDSQDISAGVVFSLTEDSDSVLSIDSATGEVSINAPADHEQQSVYSFGVIATDIAGNVSEAQSVTLDINDLDDAAPSVNSSSAANSVDENSASGQIVYTATADDTADDVSDAPITFSLAGSSDTEFSINSETGEVSFNAVADHESDSQYSFAVIATDGAGNVSEAHSVTLDINDLDDAAPAVDSGDTANSVDENSASGQIVYTATADDTADDVSDGPITFSLADSSDTEFSINSETGEVSFNAIADHESNSQYSFAVIATDGAGNVGDAKTVILDIDDVDDTSPIITSSTVSAVNENNAIGQVVYAATADDSADVESGPVIFSLAEGSDSALAIDANSGEVTLTEISDYEVQNQYNFAVIATDVAGNASEAFDVTLTVNNLDEVAPTLTSGDTASSIIENSVAGQVVYTATAEDIGDVSEGVTFSLKDADSSLFTVDADTGVVTFNQISDYEITSNYSFTIVATDGAGLSDEQVVSLAIMNTDDTGPVFTSSAAADAVDENTVVVGVYAAQASDDDSDLTSGPITYSLADDSNGAFSIDSATGEVSLSMGLDGDDNNLYSFTVVASDGEGNESSQIVSLLVNDIDDTAPVITSGDTAISVVENSSAGQVVYAATADDSSDLNDGAPLTFGITGADSDAFTINSNSGEVTLNVSPDYDTQSAYSFTVTATDSVGLVGEKLVTMGVGNVIDAPPTFTSSTVAEIEENIGVDQVIYTAIAESDGGNSDVTYSLTVNNVYYYQAGAIVQNFDVNDEGGYSMELSIDPIVALAEDNSLQNYNMEIIYDIDEIGQLTEDNIIFLQEKLYVPMLNIVDSVVSVGAIHVVYDFSGPDLIEDTLDISNQPTILTVNFTYNVGVTSAGFEITTITINENNEQRDASSARVFEDVALSIAENTGEVTLLSNPDYEAQSAYSFTVTATDELGSTEQTILINVLDRDDSAPTVISSNTAVIDENSGENQVVYTALSNFSDTTFSLTDNSSGLFSINATSGEVTLSENPDYESLQSYSFTVVSTLLGFDSPERVVTLTVNNLDEIAPSITSGNTAISMDENTGAGQVVYTAIATDSDYNGTETTTYSLAAGSDSGLSIDANTGEVTLAVDPNFEAQSQYSFTVIATDAAGNASAGQPVTFDISDLDEVAPSITSADTAISIDENSGAGQVIYTATADDSLDISAGYTFSLAAGSDAAAFSINANSGEVTLLEDPDFEVMPEYSFDVIATDGAGNSDVHTVTLSINDIDQSPMITSGDIDVILEGSGSDQVVYTATSNIDGATFSLVDNTVYPAAGNNSEPAVTVVTIPELASTTQHVYVSESTKSEDGTQAIVKVSYNADDSTLTGLGLRIHYDSSAFTLSDISNVLSSDLFIPPTTSTTADTDDFDNDASTDSYILASWTSLFGQWPNATPTDLMTMTFDIAEGASGLSAINFTSSSNAAGFAFDGQQHNVAVVESAGDSSDSSAAAESVVSIPDLAAATQHVYVSESTKSEDGSQAIVKVSYNADDSTLTGLGLRIHYDSSAFTLSDVSNVLSSDLFIPPTTSATADTNDYDNDASTDSYILASWTSLFGQWPNAAPTDLMTMTFDIAEGASGSSTINLTSSSNAAGFTFDGQSHDVV
ncbi:MAG: cadherin repeat domain-containing protein, partial [Porticoccaceae bacterium]|nr:cadherin repeat domain-containing protein [Porticoccaceae bacterium]